MTYQEYNPAVGWKGVVLDDNQKPYLWLKLDGTWVPDTKINRGPFGGDVDVAVQWARAEGFLSGEAKCMACGWEFNAVFSDPDKNGELECPKCHAAKGIIFST